MIQIFTHTPRWGARRVSSGLRSDCWSGAWIRNSGMAPYAAALYAAVKCARYVPRLAPNTASPIARYW